MLRSFRLVRSIRESRKLSVAREFTYFDNVEVKDGVAIVRFNGPAKMNTISISMQDDANIIFKEKILANKEVKAEVFISSKPDNFIAGADINMIENFEDKSELPSLLMKAHSLFDEIKKYFLPGYH